MQGSPARLAIVTAAPHAGNAVPRLEKMFLHVSTVCIRAVAVGSPGAVLDIQGLFIHERLRGKCFRGARLHTV